MSSPKVAPTAACVEAQAGNTLKIAFGSFVLTISLLKGTALFRRESPTSSSKHKVTEI